MCWIQVTIRPREGAGNTDRMAFQVRYGNSTLSYAFAFATQKKTTRTLTYLTQLLGSTKPTFLSTKDKQPISSVGG